MLLSEILNGVPKKLAPETNDIHLHFNGYWLTPDRIPAHGVIYAVYRCRHNALLQQVQLRQTALLREVQRRRTAVRRSREGVRVAIIPSKRRAIVFQLCVNRRS